MIQERSIKISTYASSPEDVIELRKLVRLWVVEDGFWDFDSMLASLSKPFVVLKYLVEEGVSSWRGVIIYQAVLEQADLIYVFIRPEDRAKGYATLLLEHMFEQLRALATCRQVFLEVKDMNKQAQALYTKFGFEETRRIKGYYATGHDAIVLVANLHA